MIWVIVLFSLLITAADVRFYCRRIARRSRGVRIVFIVAAAIANTLPLLIAGLFRLLPDNTTAMMSLALWILWIYLLLAGPRLAYYALSHFKLKKTGIAAGIAVAALLVWGATYGRTHLRVEQVEMHLDRLPAAFDGFRIALFSDTHLGTLVRPEQELKRLVEVINAQHPDLVIFSGDLVNIRYTELDSLSMHILSGIKAPYGVISTLGNHDTGVYVKDTLSLPVAENTARLIERQQAMGWRVLDDTTEYLTRCGDTISVTGISFDPAFRKQRHDRKLDYDLKSIYSDARRDLCNITVSHLPQLWNQITAEGFGDLTLSGHVHAMQLSLNIGSWRFSPAQILYKQWSGLYQDDDDRYLYINDGTGYVGYPMRLGTYPEITVITLRQ